jgi:hypothetical protein
VTTTSFDGAGRVTLQESGSAGGGGTIATVIQSTATQYDGDGNPIFVATSQLNPDGENYRTSYVANWFDPAGQVTTTANYGTNLGNAMSARPGTVPARSSAVLVTGCQYDAGGFLCLTTDPTGMQTSYSNDWLGRVVREVVNSAATWPSPVQTITSFSYDGLNRETVVTVLNVSPAMGQTPATEQKPSITQYQYGATTANGSDINSNDLLWRIQFPDGTSQQDSYDALGELISQTNRDQSVHEFEYDQLGRQTLDSVVKFATGVDTTVAALGTTYDTLGDVTFATSYAWSGVILNQVENVYDGLRNLVTQYQALSGAVNTIISPYTPAVQYQYTTEYEGQGNYSRLTGITYPGGTQVNYAYAGLNDLDDSISRMTSVADTGVTVETYRYLGLSTLVGATLPEPSIYETETLDNFGNVADIAWTQGGTLTGNTVSGGTGLVNVAYTYDQVGDVLSRDDEIADAAGAGLDQTYSHDTLHRLTGYNQGAGTLSNGVFTIPSPTLSSNWFLDSQGNRYNDGNTTFGTSYNTADQSASGPTVYTPGSGDASTISFGTTGSVTVKYDSWGRVAQTNSGLAGDAGPNGAAWYTNYSYDALGRQIATSNVSTSSVVISGTQTYFDGANPIEVRLQDNSTLLETNVWSPADGRMILRDAVAAALTTYTNLNILPNTTGGVIQRLYPLTDGIGSIVAVASPSIPVGDPASNYVQERYTYTVDGLPQALNPNWTARTVATVSQFSSVLGWNWLYRDQQWVQTQPDTSTTQWRGLYVSAAGVWSDPIHATTLQPNLSDYGVPQSNPYQMSAFEKFGATFAPAMIGIGVGIIAGIATGGLGLTLLPGIIAGMTGGAASLASSTYAAGGDAGQIAESALIGGAAGAVGGAAGAYAGAGANLLSQALGLTCSNGLGMAGGLLMGAAEGAAYGATEAFTRTALMGGSAVDAVMAGWNAGILGAEIGGPLGAIFHELCFADGTLVHKQIGVRAVETQRPCNRLLTLETLATAHLPGDDPTAIDPAHFRLVRLRTAKPLGSDNILTADLIRPVSWLAQNGVVVGGVIRFRVPELEIDATVDVVAVEACPPIEPGRGRVVTGKFTTLKCRVLQVQVSGEEKPLEPTAAHRFKSLDRNDWVPAEELRIGEKLETKTGEIVVVESIVAKPGLYRVHNFEVEGEHHFFVGKIGVLVHNTYADRMTLDEKDAWAQQYAADVNNGDATDWGSLTAKQQRAVREYAVSQGYINGDLLHGNNLATTAPARGYALVDKQTGEVLHYGETTMPGTTRYSDEYLKEINARMDFQASGTKAEMHDWQNQQILDYMYSTKGLRPPLNFSNY